MNGRRGFLGAAAALSAPLGIGAQPAPPTPPPSAASDPDAELLAACAEFDRLERAYIATFPDDHDVTEHEEDAVQPERDLIQQAQHYLAARMVELRATTLAGQVARARSLVLWEGDDPSGNVTSEYINERLLGAILGDLTEGSVGA